MAYFLCRFGCFRQLVKLLNFPFVFVFHFPLSKPTEIQKYQPIVSLTPKFKFLHCLCCFQHKENFKPCSLLMWGALIYRGNGETFFNAEVYLTDILCLVNVKRGSAFFVSVSYLKHLVIELTSCKENIKLMCLFDPLIWFLPSQDIL